MSLFHFIDLKIGLLNLPYCECAIGVYVSKNTHTHTHHYLSLMLPLNIFYNLFAHNQYYFNLRRLRVSYILCILHEPSQACNDSEN